MLEINKRRSFSQPFLSWKALSSIFYLNDENQIRPTKWLLLNREMENPEFIAHSYFDNVYENGVCSLGLSSVERRKRDSFWERLKAEPWLTEEEK